MLLGHLLLGMDVVSEKNGRIVTWVAFLNNESLSWTITYIGLQHDADQIKDKFRNFSLKFANFSHPSYIDNAAQKAQSFKHLTVCFN